MTVDSAGSGFLWKELTLVVDVVVTCSLFLLFHGVRCFDKEVFNRRYDVT